MGDDHSLLLRPRREAFDYALLPIPIPNLPISTSANLTLFLTNLKRDLLLRSTPIDSSTVADALNVQRDLSALILDTISSVLPAGNEADRGVVDVCDLLLFLYLQSYKRMVPSRINKDSPSVSDVWPSNSAFDRVLSAMSPVQLVRSNSRRFMPSQADEEIHQLSYLQKHMANMLMLLADPVEGEDDDHMVLTADSFEHLALLIQFFKHGSGGIPLQKAASFFTSLDQDNPSLSIPATQIHEWILQNITVSLEHFCGKVTEKENDQNNTVDVGDSKGDDSGDHTRSHVVLSLPPVVVEGVSKASVVKQEHDIRGTSVKVINCHESVVYILAPLRYATIHGCSDATVILGAVGKVNLGAMVRYIQCDMEAIGSNERVYPFMEAVRVEHCERLQIIVAAKRICVANCRECVLYLGVNEKPVFLGDNHKLTVAPYNTFYSQLNEHINRVSLDATINKWNEPFMLGMIDSLDSLSHPAGLADVQSELPICLDPDMFTNFVIPNWFSEDSTQPTIINPFELPETYTNSIKKHHMALDDIQQTIRDAQLEEKTKRELTCALHLRFKEWLYASGNIRQLYFLQDDSCSEVGLAQQRI